MSTGPTNFRGFPPEARPFLSSLAENNNRDWFLAHKSTYERVCKGPMMDLVADLGPALADREMPLFGDPKRAIFRINRDIRFARDKSPYKTTIAAVLTRDGDKRSQGLLYIQVGHDSLFAALGFYQLEPDDLAAFRDHVVKRQKAWRSIENDLASQGLHLSRESAAARLPRGYDPAAVGDLAETVRLKSFTVAQPLTEAAIADAGLVSRIADFAARGRALLHFGWDALATERARKG